MSHSKNPDQLKNKFSWPHERENHTEAKKHEFYRGQVPLRKDRKHKLVLLWQSIRSAVAAIQMGKEK